MGRCMWIAWLRVVVRVRMCRVCMRERERECECCNSFVSGPRNISRRRLALDSENVVVERAVCVPH